MSSHVKLNNLNKYMLTSKKLSLLVKKAPIRIIHNKKRYTHKSSKKYFIPNYDDKLFWIFYVLVNGRETYELITSNFYQVQQEEKMKYMKKILESKQILKQHNFKKIKESCDDLINCKELSIRLFHMLCVVYNIPFLYIKGNICYEFKLDDNNEDPIETNVIHYINDIYCYEKVENIEIIENIKTIKQIVNDYERPLKSLGSYKIEDLHVFATKFNISLINGIKKRTKKELYEILYEIFYGKEEEL